MAHDRRCIESTRVPAHLVSPSSRHGSDRAREVTGGDGREARREAVVREVLDRASARRRAQAIAEILVFDEPADRGADGRRHRGVRRRSRSRRRRRPRGIRRCDPPPPERRTRPLRGTRCRTPRLRARPTGPDSTSRTRRRRRRARAARRRAPARGTCTLPPARRSSRSRSRPAPPIASCTPVQDAARVDHDVEALAGHEPRDTEHERPVGVEAEPDAGRACAHRRRAGGSDRRRRRAG